MSFERLTDEGPKGRKATFAVGKTPQPLGVAFVRSTNPKANCRLERTTYEMTALSATTFVRCLPFSQRIIFSNHLEFFYFFPLTLLLILYRMFHIQ